MRLTLKSLAALALVLCVSGCASYEYNLVQPADLSRHIGAKSDQVIALAPLQYRLRTVENRLVMRVYNPGADPIELRGAQSTVVDPDGQSHPLPSQTIAPDSFIKLIFPPIAPRVYGPEPAIGIGMGYGWRVDALPTRRAIDAPRPYSMPQYCAVVAGSDNFYWDWHDADGEMRLNLVFQQQGKEFRQSFVFRRQKM